MVFYPLCPEVILSSSAAPPVCLVTCFCCDRQPCSVSVSVNRGASLPSSTHPGNQSLLQTQPWSPGWEQQWNVSCSDGRVCRELLSWGTRARNLGQEMGISPLM